MKFPVIELVDRLAIAQVKYEKTQSNRAELDWYQNQIQEFDFSTIQHDFIELKSVHQQIWTLESDLKSFREHLHSLEEIGRRAIMIRDLNHKRISLKNSMAEKLYCPVREIKSDHLSE